MYACFVTVRVATRADQSAVSRCLAVRDTHLDDLRVPRMQSTLRLLAHEELRVGSQLQANHAVARRLERHGLTSSPPSVLPQRNTHTVKRCASSAIARVSVRAAHSRNGVRSEVALTRNQLVVLAAVRVVLAVRAHEAQAVVHGA